MTLLTAESIQFVPNQSGTYKIYALAADGLPIPINRFAGTDNSGLLYIGRASRQPLRKRVYNFLATARAGALTTNHPGGLKYRTIDTVRNVLGQHALYFDVEPCNDSVVREVEQLSNYRHQFGEYPPLNK